MQKSLAFFVIIILFLLPVFGLAQGQNYKVKTLSYNLVTRSKSKIYVLPFFYDSTEISDEKILHLVDSLPRRGYMKLIRLKEYYILNKEDTGKIAIRVNAGKHGYGISQFQLNGYCNRSCTYDRRYNKVDFTDHFDNGMKKIEGHFKNNERSRWWSYYDLSGCIVRVEKYRHHHLAKTSIYKHHRVRDCKGYRTTLGFGNYRVI